jgi:hypothetical protein
MSHKSKALEKGYKSLKGCLFDQQVDIIEATLSFVVTGSAWCSKHVQDKQRPKLASNIHLREIFRDEWILRQQTLFGLFDLSN